MSFMMRLLSGALALVLLGVPADAQAWPAKPLRVIVPIGAGSSVDLVARIVCEQLGNELDCIVKALVSDLVCHDVWSLFGSAGAD